ncbi:MULTISPECIES: ribosome biogenesis GTP-binding protein YihA/YsxC [Tissierellales]|jgi:GTP-binding protein|uniref:Probable GTP-binding protein EngB n=1 Tax=Acidilutibacter cellobiosedens TaxID=2507161 RepID=A0A410QF28_9FIRM|nr:MULTISPECIES: ribosome biogenesis GTP-binding protein YihA/YsxC [Tissierellales]MBE6082626.1 YihA family ribosome biogenesis GTP-binding protein [Tissierellaceae bacterium]QAT62504.1 YihA family ribosome biogenesis GTP-binding protein [Acidilutibacter cellobiosedens]SCL94438.1 putative GTP-binding protein EngB [Sporanaerobacter sp. PP17-6a]
MKINKSEITALAVNEKQYPKDNKFEIAFAGRSNVGKSSLINTLTNRKSLAKTSNKPGKTRTINFYNINDQFRLVDLPGYGYAQVSKGEKEKWSKMIDDYLHNRENLVEVILLLDIRHEPGEHDLTMYKWIKSYGFNGIAVCTKSDKLSKSQITKQISVIKKKLGIADENLIIPYSAEKRMNIELIWEIIEEILEVNEKQQLK